MKQPAFYIIASQKNGTIYIGVTSNLVKRIYKHKASLIKGFTSIYKCTILVYYTLYNTMEEEIKKEKILKGYRRDKKLKFIESTNPGWIDLYNSICH